MTKIPKEVQEFMQGKMGWVANLHFKSMGDEMSKTSRATTLQATRPSSPPPRKSVAFCPRLAAGLAFFC